MTEEIAELVQRLKDRARQSESYRGAIVVGIEEVEKLVGALREPIPEADAKILRGPPLTFELERDGLRIEFDGVEIVVSSQKEGFAFRGEVTSWRQDVFPLPRRR